MGPVIAINASTGLRVIRANDVELVVLVMRRHWKRGVDHVNAMNMEMKRSAFVTFKRANAYANTIPRDRIVRNAAQTTTEVQ